MDARRRSRFPLPEPRLPNPIRMTWRSRPQPRNRLAQSIRLMPSIRRSAVRHRLHQERASITHKFSIGGHEGYITVGHVSRTAEPGEIFITMAKEGSTVSGVMDCFAHRHLDRLAARRALEPAVREVRAHALRAQRLDRQLRHRLCQVDHGLHLPLAAVALRQRTVRESCSRVCVRSRSPQSHAVEEAPAVAPAPTTDKRPAAGGKYHASDALKELVDMGDAPSCHVCGAIMTRNGSCYRCMTCGSTSGCS